nr:restriction endonuclease subunit S [uncultured Prevotella sp.]
METTTYKISDIGEVVGGGTPSTANSDFWGGDIPWISPKDLTGYKSVYISHGESFLNKTGLKSGTKLLPKDTVLFSSRAPIGYVAIASNPICTNQGFKSIICNKEIINPLFLYYYIKGNLDYIKLFGTGATFPEISGAAMRKIKVQIPSLPTQQKIASILSAYDRLIENNTRRIRLLEQMAENLYKEWFAYHKIKGQSTAVKLKEVVSITRGLSYSSEEIDCTDGNNLINLKNIQGYGGFRLDGTKLYNGKYKPEQIVEEGDLIMGVTDMTQDRRTVGSVALIPNVNTLSVISADLVKINSSIDNTYLYAMFRYGNVSRHIAQFANGANVLHLRPKSILNIKVFLPNQDIIDSFVSKVKPMIQLTNRLNTEIDSLTRQRDLLLPRLMSGKLEVKS